MNTKHTPGPWRATILDTYGRFEISPADGGRMIAKGRSWGDATSAEEQEANARLIAAAPDLLNSLRPFACLTQNTLMPIMKRVLEAAALDAETQGKDARLAVQTRDWFNREAQAIRTLLEWLPRFEETAQTAIAKAEGIK